MYQTIEQAQDGPVVTVALNRPEVRNAFNAPMIAELTQVFTELASSPQTRVVILRSYGPAFSAGADVSWMRASLDFSRDENRADAERMFDMFDAIDRLPVPVIGRIHGAALGGGMGLLAVCDIVVAEEETVFGFTEARLGIIPAVISRFVLPKIGPTWARALYLTAERFGPETARQIGLVHWVVPSAQLDASIRQRIDDILAGGPEAVKSAKQLIAQAVRLDQSELRLFTAERIASLRSSPEGQEGLRAFLEKRAAGWRSEG
jgi:methylglutaconyl-CoA hydratase